MHAVSQVVREFGLGQEPFRMRVKGKKNYDTRLTRVCSICLVIAVIIFVCIQISSFHQEESFLVGIKRKGRQIGGVDLKIFDVMGLHGKFQDWHGSGQTGYDITFLGVDCDRRSEDGYEIWDQCRSNCQSECHYCGTERARRTYDQVDGWWRGQGSTFCQWRSGWWSMTHAVILITPTNSELCNSQISVLGMTSAEPTSSSTGYTEEIVEMVTYLRNETYWKVKLVMEEIRIKKHSKWFPFKSVDSEKVLFQARFVTREDYEVDYGKASIPGSNFSPVPKDSPCATEIWVDVSDSITDVTIWPDTLLTLIAKIGGLTTAILGLAVLLRVYNIHRLQKYLDQKSISVESLMESIEYLQKVMEIDKRLKSATEEFPGKKFWIPV